MSVLSPTPVLENLSFGRRALAYSAVALGNAIALAARRHSGGTGRLLVAFANLGDQLRMMNVWSRYAPETQYCDVVCNRPTAEAFSLYAGVGKVFAYAEQGAESLIESLRNVLGARARYAQCYVPHPFFTRPLALAYARTHGAAVIAMAGRGTAAAVTVPLDASSWRATYERFAAACFPSVSPGVTPRLANGIHRQGGRSRRVVLQLTSSARSKMLDAAQCRAIAKGLRELGLRVFAIGAATDETQLKSLLDETAATIVCGAPLREVAQLLCETDLFVGVDSSMMQLADAIGVPCVIVYTTTIASVTGPFYAPFVAVEASGRFRPVGVEPESSWRPKPDAALRIPPDAVIDAARDLLGRY